MGGSLPAGAGGGKIGENTPDYTERAFIRNDGVSNISAFLTSDQTVSDQKKLKMAKGWGSQDKEYGIALSGDDKVLITREGNENTIEVTNEDGKLLSWYAGAKFCHNHPSGIGKGALPALSDGDMGVAMNHNMSEVVAINDTGFIKMKINKIPDKHRFYKIIEKAYMISRRAENYAIFTMRYKEDRSDYIEALQAHWLMHRLINLAYPNGEISFEYGYWDKGHDNKYMDEVLNFPMQSGWIQEFTMKGGKGSGHFGHAGRPGKVGGSLPAGAGGGIIGENTPNITQIDTQGIAYTNAEILAYKRSRDKYERKFYKIVGGLEKDIAYASENDRTVYMSIDQNGERVGLELSAEQAQDLLEYTKQAREERRQFTAETLGLPRTLAELNEQLGFDVSKTKYDDLTEEQKQSIVDFRNENITRIMRAEISDISLDDVDDVWEGIQDEVVASSISQGWTEENIHNAPEYENFIGNFLIEQHRIEEAVEFNIDHQLSLGRITPEVATLRGGGDSPGGEWELLPDVMYHVTTNAAAVLSDQLRSRRELRGRESEVGLGGGQDETISFTQDLGTALMIERALQEAHMVASGEYSFSDMVGIARTGGGGVGHPWLRPLLAHWIGERNIPDNFDENDEDTYPPVIKELIDGSFTKRHDQAFINKVWDFWHIYFVTIRKMQGGFDDPLFFGTNIESLAKLDPGEIKILKVKPKPGAMGFKVSALGEIRTVGGDTIDIQEIMDEIKPSEIRKIIG